MTLSVLTTAAATMAAIGAGALGGTLGHDEAPHTALVIDASQARSGRDLVDPRLRAADAEIRIPRTEAEALTDVRYLAAQDRRLVVSGPLAEAAADEARVPARRAPDLPAALVAAR